MESHLSLVTLDGTDWSWNTRTQERGFQKVFVCVTKHHPCQHLKCEFLLFLGLNPIAMLINCTRGDSTESMKVIEKLIHQIPTDSICLLQCDLLHYGTGFCPLCECKLHACTVLCHINSNPRETVMSGDYSGWTEAFQLFSHSLKSLQKLALGNFCFHLKINSHKCLLMDSSLIYNY